MDLSPSVDDGEKVERKGKGKKKTVFTLYLFHLGILVFICIF